MIRKIDSNKFSLTILKVTTFSRIRQGDTTILCLLVEPSLFEKTELGDFQAINDPKTTLSELDKSAQERMYLKLVEEIERITSSCN